MNSSTKSTQSEESNADICQCPKCLEVQERREVCIKCGLIFKKYFETERLKNSVFHSASMVDELQASEPLDPRNLKFNSLLNKSALLYLLAAALISIFDIGELQVSKFYCDVVKALVPSLYGTSIISNEPNNTCLIIALAWTMSIVTIILVIKWLIKQPIKETVTLVQDGGVSIRLLGLALSMAVAVEAYFVALTKAAHGFISKTTYGLVSNWAFTSALWGLVIYSSIVLILIFVISFVVEIVDKCASEK